MVQHPNCQQGPTRAVLDSLDLSKIVPRHLYKRGENKIRVFLANSDRFQIRSRFVSKTSVLALVLYKSFTCANGLLEFCELQVYLAASSASFLHLICDLLPS